MSIWMRWLVAASCSVILSFATSIVGNLVSSAMETAAQHCPSKFDIVCYAQFLPWQLCMGMLVMWGLNIAFYPWPQRPAPVPHTAIRAHWLARGKIIQQELTVTLALAQQGVSVLNSQELVISPTSVSVEDLHIAQAAWNRAGVLLKRYREQHTQWRAALLEARRMPQTKRRSRSLGIAAQRLTHTTQLLISQMPTWPISGEHGESQQRPK